MQNSRALAAMGRKLDLSKLSDEEAKHVWEVIQRDLSLRRIEEERLEDLKSQVEKESNKRELLSNQSHLNETHCVHCLQPFKFLLNSKRQCQDCQFYACKNCSRYNKKEQGWVCDTCRVTRMVKIGSLGWYYEPVYSRFKRFGSAKVMRSLYPRLHSEMKGGTNLTGLQDRVQSLPDINREYLRQARSGMYLDGDEMEDTMDSAEAQRYSMSFSEYTGSGKDTAQKESLIAEAELASMFHHLLQEQGQLVPTPEQGFSTEVRLTVNSRRRSLEINRRPNLPFLTESQENNPYPDPQLTRTRYIPKGSPSLAPKGSQYSGDMDTSEEEGGTVPKVPPKRRSRASSQENVHHSGIQITELNKRMLAIERMLNRLEERISGHSDESTGLGVLTDADLEEKTLKRKIGELASNISDKGGSSEEEKNMKLRAALSSSSEGQSNQAQKVYIVTETAPGLEKKLRDMEERARQSGTTDSELSELEVNVASATAQVQQAESEVSDIESRIAALSAAGLTVTPAGKSKRKSSPRVFAPAISRSTEPFQPSAPELDSLPSTPSEAKILSMQQALRKKLNNDTEMPDGAFERNVLYRGSLTQRNPNGKNKKANRNFAKPVLTQR
ncbi:melanophilin isoform X4 [Ascaphus truei]|uniref:melanophilin isoform X4 n=1 Tax=Ascaphus truei TaxID=8439 RepID=UPI003F5A939F